MWGIKFYLKKMKKLFPILCLLLFFEPLSIKLFAKNGFVIQEPLIPNEEILAGGPPKDGIPAINHPKFDKAQDTKIKDNQRVLGVFYQDIAKAYPINILNWHELVNDSINKQKFVVSYCPLCGTGVVFSANIQKVKTMTLTFGVSGLLYNSDVLLYDHQTESLWSQLLGKAISGKYKGTPLSILVSENTTWGKWKIEHPKSLILSEDTGFSRNYNRDPYAGYEKSRSIFFKVSHKAPEIYHPKELILGLEINGKFKAYPFVELSKQGKSEFVDNWNQQKLIIHWDEQNRAAKITNEKGKSIPSLQSFWFAWYTFHPKTALFQASK